MFFGVFCISLVFGKVRAFSILGRSVWELRGFFFRWLAIFDYGRRWTG